MELKILQKLAGRRVRLVLQDGKKMSGVLPQKITEDFAFKDMYHNEFLVSCKYINFVKVYTDDF